MTTTASHKPGCKGWDHSFSHPTAAIAKMLRLERQGLETLAPELVGSLAKLTHYDPSCRTCCELAGREVQRRLILMKRVEVQP
jgi:hypothetical protein